MFLHRQRPLCRPSPHWSLCNIDETKSCTLIWECSGNDNVSACWLPASNWENQVCISGNNWPIISVLIVTKTSHGFFWAHFIWMNLYLLLLNEHKKVCLDVRDKNHTSLFFFTPCFIPTLFKRPTLLLTLHLVFTLTVTKDNILNMMPAEPGALIKYMTLIATFCQSEGVSWQKYRGRVS